MARAWRSRSNLGRHGRSVFVGALVVAKPKDQLATRVVPLLGRLALALLGGLVVALVLAAYLSRRLTRPVLELSRAADEVARGNYDVAVPASGAATRSSCCRTASA